MKHETPFSITMLCSDNQNKHMLFFLTSMCQLLNHPHLSAHIDETDEDALSYMTDLEVGSVDVLLQSLALVHAW